MDALGSGNENELNMLTFDSILITVGKTLNVH
jgi:hypothetical protein